MSKNRLTEKDGQGNWCLKGVPWKNLYVGERITEEVNEKINGALWKLLDYEETGLSPRDIERMDEMYQEKCEEVAKLKERLKEGYHEK